MVMIEVKRDSLTFNVTLTQISHFCDGLLGGGEPAQEVEDSD